MKKVQVVLDEKKIIADRQYNLQKIYAAIDRVFVDKYGLIKGQDGFYFESGTKDDFADFWSAILLLPYGNAEKWEQSYNEEKSEEYIEWENIRASDDKRILDRLRYHLSDYPDLSVEELMHKLDVDNDHFRDEAEINGDIYKWMWVTESTVKRLVKIID